MAGGGGKGRAAGQDEGIRQEVIASTGKSMLVEAAAGTGKTTLIVDRIVQGIRDGSLKLPSTVAITFTEKAAGELDSRIRERLAAEIDRGDLGGEGARRVREAAEELDRANISTIHAFCARILKEKPAEAGADPEFAVLDETAAEVLRERCWREWMDGQVAESAEPLVEALRAGARVEQLRALAFALADAPEILERERFRMAVPPTPPEALLSAMRKLAPGVADLFLRQLKTKGNDDSRKLLRSARGMAASGAGDDTIRRLAYAAAGASVDEALKSLRAEAREEAAPLLSEFVGAAQALGAHLAADVFGWAAGFAGHYRDAKLSRSVLDFQDLLLLAARLLRDKPEVRLYFQRRFKAFFVDEFQDTDPLQAEVIAYLCEAPGARPARRMEDVRLADGKLFAVGDPKQSIYRFRRADVQVYDRFKGLFGATAFGEDRTRQIFCNWRSVPRLLEWFNLLFERLLAGRPEPGVYQASHVALQPPPGARPTPEAAPAVIALYPPRNLTTGDWKAPDARLHEAQFVAKTIRKAVDGELPLGVGPVSYRDFALLFRALSDVDIYEDALDVHDVPYRVIGGKRFYKREQIVETLAVLQAVDDPLNEAAILGALRSSFFGISDEELLRYHERGGQWNYLLTEQQEGPVGEGMRTLAAWHQRRNRVPPQALLREVFDATKAPQAFLLKPAGPQRAANLEKLSSQLRALGAATGNFGAVVRHLTAVQEAELPEEESSVLEPGDDFVRILSMHKAKGLQFPVVVLPDLAREFQDRTGPLLFNRRDGRVGLELLRGIRSEDYEQLAAEEFGNQRAEERRLLYVACTRAEKLLVVPLFWLQKGKKESFQELLDESGRLAQPDDVRPGEERGGVRYLDAAGWLPGMDFSRRPRRRAQDATEEAAALLEERRRWQESHAGLVCRASSAEPVVLPSAMEVGFEMRGLSEEAAHGTGGKDFGSLFHNLMAQIPLEHALDEEMSTLVRNLAAIEAGELPAGPPDGRRTDVAAGIEAAGAPLSDAMSARTAASEAAELALAALKNADFVALREGADVVAKEVAFSVPLRRLSISNGPTPGFVEGSMDLLIRRGRRTTILDYKTDRFDPTGREAVEGRYWLQLALYALVAQACGHAGREVELALFFVRPGTISRRDLDRELIALVARRVETMLTAAE